MNEKEIFERSKKLALNKGKVFRSSSEFVGGSDLSGEIYLYSSGWEYHGEKIKIKYFKEQYGDGSGKIEELKIFEKVFPFLPKVLRYDSIRMTNSPIAEITRKTIGGNWERSLEDILFNNA